MANSTQFLYQPAERCHHSTHIIEEHLYMWGGEQNDIQLRSDPCLEVLQLSTGKWEQKITNGISHPGIIGYASAVLSNSLIFFGGHSNHPRQYYNNLTALNVKSIAWSSLTPVNSDSGPMPKAFSQMISMKFQQKDHLIVFGGTGPQISTNPQYGAHYCDLTIDGIKAVATNEIHYFRITDKKWLVPSVTGEGPSVCSRFTLTQISENTAVAFGGDRDDYHKDNAIYIATFTKSSLSWQKMSEPLDRLVDWPCSRWGHRTVYLGHGRILVVGGAVEKGSNSDSWLCLTETHKLKWQYLYLPDTVTKRWNHSLSVWRVTSNSLWLVIFGGVRSVFGHLVNDAAVIQIQFDGHRLLFGEVIGHPLAGKIVKSSQYQDDDPPKTSLFSWKKSKPRKIQQVQADHQQLIDDSRIIEETLHRQLQDIVRENQEIYQLKEKVEEERQSLVKKCEQQQVLLQKKGQEKEEMAEKVNHQDEQIYKLKKDKAKLVQKVYQQQNLLQKMKEEKEQLLVEIDQKHQRTKEEEAKYELQMLELEELRSTVVSDQNDVESYHEAKLALQERTTELQKMTEQIKAIEKDHRELENELKDIKLAKESLEREAEESKMKEKCLIEDHNKIQRDLHEQLRDIVASTNQTVLSLKEDVNQLQIAKEFNEKQNKELRVKMEELEQINDCLSQQNKELTSSCSWILQEEEIHATNEVLGKGSWGVVKVAIFKRTRVAAKYMNELNISRYNIAIFTREMELLAQVRHPNLVQFLGATRERRPIIITELLTTSLRKAIEKSSLTRPQIIKISLDICNGLNYLHSWRSQPLIHRNLSSTNILLEPTAVDREWRAKISDYVSTSLSGPTNITSSSVYCPPEGYNPNEHSPLMDVYSFGVLAMEMILSELPPITVAERDIQATTIRWPLMKKLIQKCISHKKQERPQIFQVIFDLNNITE